MNFKTALLGFIGTTVIAASAHAETALFPTVLGSKSLWETSTFAALSSVGPAVFTYSLLSTQTSHVTTQTFSVNGSNVFTTGQAAPATATSGGAITVTSFAFDSNVGSDRMVSSSTTNPYKKAAYEIFQLKSNPTTFALAYEDDYHVSFTDPNGGDFNDMVVKMSVAAVPEPETYAMMAAGLGALAFVSRRRRAA